MGKKVRYIDTSGSMTLNVGQIYEVEHETTTAYQLAGLGGTWTKTRFEEEKWLPAVGDKVECINNSSNANELLKVGGVYTVQSIDIIDSEDTNPLIHVCEILDEGFFLTRFKPATTVNTAPTQPPPPSLTPAAPVEPAFDFDAYYGTHKTARKW